MKQPFFWYEVGKVYEGLERGTPKEDSAGLVFEGVPIYKIWLQAPMELEFSILQSTCTRIGITKPSGVIGRMPYAVFARDKGAELTVRAPICSVASEVERWSDGDSNIFVFVLIDRGSRVVKSITTVGVPDEFKRILSSILRARTHYRDLEPAQRNAMLTALRDKDALNSSDVWVFDPATKDFKPQFARPSEGHFGPRKAQLFEMKTIEIAKGERIRFTANDRLLRVSKLDRGTVLKVNAEGDLSVLLENGRVVNFNLKKHPFIEYAYATGTAKPYVESTNRIILDEDPERPDRLILIQEVLERTGYVPIERPADDTAAFSASTSKT